MHTGIGSSWCARLGVAALGLASALALGCASGNGNDDDGANDSSGSVGDGSEGGSSSGGATSATSATSASTTATTAETLSTTAATAESDSGAMDSSTGEATLDCTSYCDVYMTACVDHSEYANTEDCMANCEQWPVGDAADTGADSLGCRLYHATVAGSTDPELHCPHAGPSGAQTCVAAEAPTCDLYCMRYFTNCTGDLNAFMDTDECMAECSTWYPGAETDVSGHTVGCHSYHANAAVSDAETHCPHAGPGGGGICVL